MRTTRPDRLGRIEQGILRARRRQPLGHIRRLRPIMLPSPRPRSDRAFPSRLVSGKSSAIHGYRVTARGHRADVLLLRNMLVNSAFALPIQQVPQDANRASAAAVLGAYYSKAVKCTLSTLTSGGPPACLTQK